MTGAVTSAAAPSCPLQAFIRPMIGLLAWGVRQGHGSFLSFDFGAPKLDVHEHGSAETGLKRGAFVHGQWHLWIYCCHWRATRDGAQLAWSEDSDRLIGRAAATLNGQKLLAVIADPAAGRSTFTFDLGGALETWPYGDDPEEEQWSILTETEAFAYRADGRYQRGPSDAPPDEEGWLPLG